LRRLPVAFERQYSMGRASFMRSKSQLSNKNGKHSARRRLAGTSIMEVILALFIFLMMSLMFAAVVPTAAQTSRRSNSYNYAVAIAQRKVDQIQEAGWSKLNETELRALGIIDASAGVADGTATVYTFTQNNTATNANNPDNLSSYFPGGTAAATRATGTIRIEPWAPSNVTLGAVTQDTLKRVTVTISWQDARTARGRFSITSLVTRMTLN
jgi:Tfp pilus assembly protein PilV